MIITHLLQHLGVPAGVASEYEKTAPGAVVSVG